MKSKTITWIIAVLDRETNKEEKDKVTVTFEPQGEWSDDMADGFFEGMEDRLREYYGPGDIAEFRAVSSDS